MLLFNFVIVQCFVPINKHICLDRFHKRQDIFWGYLGELTLKSLAEAGHNSAGSSQTLQQLISLVSLPL